MNVQLTSNELSNSLGNAPVLGNPKQDQQQNPDKVKERYNYTVDFRYICIKKEHFDVSMIYLKYMNLKKLKLPTEYAIKLGENPSFRTNTIPELYILSIINDIPIIIYDDLNNPIFIYDNGLLYNKFDVELNKKDIQKYINKTNRQKYINIKFIYISNNDIPDYIETIYYK